MATLNHFLVSNVGSTYNIEISITDDNGDERITKKTITGGANALAWANEELEKSNNQVTHFTQKIAGDTSKMNYYQVLADAIQVELNKYT